METLSGVPGMGLQPVTVPVHNGDTTTTETAYVRSTVSVHGGDTTTMATAYVLRSTERAEVSSSSATPVTCPTKEG